MTVEKDGLLFAFLFDGKGGGHDLSWNEVNSWTPSQGKIWIHLAYTLADAYTWLLEKSGLEPFIIEHLDSL